MKFILAALALFVSFSATASQLEVIREDGPVKTEGYYRVDFGTTFVHHRIVQRFTLRNTGTVPLTFRDAYVSGSDFAAYHGCRNGLLPNETCPFEIEFRPFFEGFAYGRFELNFAEDQILFDLYGRAQRR